MRKLVMIFLCLSLTQVVCAQVAETRRKQFNLEGGIALQEYDPVAYFTVKKAVKGNKEMACNYQGVVYYFSSQDNKSLFLKNPGNYEPQYGGWCAYAMGDSGDKVEIDPKTFKIVDGKLYLFYNFYFTNTLTKWNAQEQALKAKADKNWLKIINGK